jgi:pyrroloquinoline-quinone synthase
MAEHQFLKELQIELKDHLAVTHPFLSKIENLNDAQLKVFASQFYLYVRMFPRLMGAVVYNVPDETSRLPLILNLINECGGLEYMEKLDNSHTHPALFRRFTQKLGINDDDLEKTKPLPSTKNLIQTYEKLYLNSPPIKAMGAVGPGTECIVPIMYVPIIEGLRKQNKFTKDDLYFFSLHLPIDEEHCEMICKALSPDMDDKKNQKLVRDGALEALDARKKFWDGLSKEILK